MSSGSPATPVLSQWYAYDLPPHLIAQQPCAERDQARLLVVRREAASLGHHVFLDLPELLKPGDLLILNDTRVLLARLLGQRRARAASGKGCSSRCTPTACGRCSARRAAD